MQNKTDQQYHDLVEYIFTKGTNKTDRTGVGTKSIFGYQMRFDLSEGFPLITRKETWFKGIIHELLWFLTGDTNIKYLTDNKVNIWNEWADENGDLGPVYGKQWVDWSNYTSFNNAEKSHYFKDGFGINQIQNAIDTLKINPDSRRIIVSAWNVAEIKDMKLAPCHVLFQLNTRPAKWGYYLDLHIYQRSCDTFLGVPFNIASYALLLELFAHCCNMSPGELIWSGGDVHLYNNHHQQVKEFLSRGSGFSLPKIELNPEKKDMFEFKYEDIKLLNYNYYPSIKAPIAV